MRSALLLAMLACGYLLSPWSVVAWFAVLDVHVYRGLRASRRRIARRRLAGTSASRREPRAV